MKNLKSIVFLLFVSLCVATSCDYKEVISTSEYERKGRLLTLEEAVNMRENYQVSIMPAIEEAQNNRLQTENYSGTQYIWIDIEHLKEYVAFLEAVEKKNADQPKISGVAIYLGAYGKDYSAQKSDKESNKKQVVNRTGDYRGRETVLLNPTFVEHGNKTDNILNHKPFKISPINPKEDKYKGTYKVFTALEYNPNKSQNASRMIMMSKKENDTDTSLADNELGTVPPM
ncbi:hypothetical protein [Lacinutrix salivirga]